MENNDFVLSEREESLLEKIVQLKIEITSIKERQAILMGELKEIREMLDYYRCDGK